MVVKKRHPDLAERGRNQSQLAVAQRDGVSEGHGAGLLNALPCQRRQ